MLLYTRKEVKQQSMGTYIMHSFLIVLTAAKLFKESFWGITVNFLVVVHTYKAIIDLINIVVEISFLTFIDDRNWRWWGSGILKFISDRWLTWESIILQLLPMLYIIGLVFWDIIESCPIKFYFLSSIGFLFWQLTVKVVVRFGGTKLQL